MSEKKEYKSNEAFDKEFESNNIPVLPWVGEDYKNNKVLVVGESHYLEFKNNEVQESYKASSDHTRNVVTDSLYGHFESNTFKNLTKMFTNSNRDLFWNNVAFYNFINRVMDKESGTDRNERPKAKDFRESWSNFVEIVNILKPTMCIFVGVAASNQFNKAISKMETVNGKVNWNISPINRTYPRKGYIEIDGNKIDLVFIKHTSHHISVDKWKDFLNENYTNKVLELVPQ